MGFGYNGHSLLLAISPESFAPLSNGRFEFRPLRPAEIFLALGVQNLRPLRPGFGSYGSVVFLLRIEGRNASGELDAEIPNPDAQIKLCMQEIFVSDSISRSRHGRLLVPFGRRRDESVTVSHYHGLRHRSEKTVIRTACRSNSPAH